MKRISFLLCIFFGISLSACPLAPKSNTPEEKWIKLIAGKSVHDPRNVSKTIVFDQRGNATWNLDGTPETLSFVQSTDGIRAIYQDTSNKKYSGFTVNSSGALEIYSADSNSIEDIDWSSSVDYRYVEYSI